MISCLRLWDSRDFIGMILRDRGESCDAYVAGARVAEESDGGKVLAVALFAELDGAQYKASWRVFDTQIATDYFTVEGGEPVAEEIEYVHRTFKRLAREQYEALCR